MWFKACTVLLVGMCILVLGASDADLAARRGELYGVRRMPDGQYEALFQLDKNKTPESSLIQRLPKKILEEEALEEMLDEEERKQDDDDGGVSMFDEEATKEKELRAAAKRESKLNDERTADALVMMQQKGRRTRASRHGHIGNSIGSIIAGRRTHSASFKSRHNNWPRGAPYVSTQAHNDWALPPRDRRYHLGPSRRRIGAGYWMQRHPKAWRRWRHPWKLHKRSKISRKHHGGRKRHGRALSHLFHLRRRRRTKVWAGWPYKFNQHRAVTHHHTSIIRPFKKRRILLALEQLDIPRHQHVSRRVLMVLQRRKGKLGFQYRRKHKSYKTGHIGKSINRIIGSKYTRRVFKGPFYATRKGSSYDWHQQETGPGGRFHMGQSRRRIGAGFGEPNLDTGRRKPNVWCESPSCKNPVPIRIRNHRHTRRHRHHRALRVRYNHGMMTFSKARRRRTKLYYQHVWHRQHRHRLKSILSRFKGRHHRFASHRV